MTVPRWFRDPLVPLRVILFVVLVALASDTQSDADLWGHVKFGDSMITGGAIPRDDPYSFTSDQPWTNHEWLAEVIMAGAYRAGGAGGLIALRLGIVGTIVALGWRFLRPVRRLSLIHDVALAALVLGIHGQTTQVRPQLFSMLLFTVLLVLLDATRRADGALLLVPVLFAAWVNLHGGWIVGGCVLAVWTAGECADRWHRRPLWPPLAALGAALAATLVNPYGTAMIGFLHQTVAFTRADIQEWQPVYALGAAFLSHWLLVVMFVVFVFLRSPRRPTVRQALLLAVLAIASFQLARIVGFFALGSVFFLLPQLEALAGAQVTPAPRASSLPDLAAPSDQSCPEAPRRGERAIEKTLAAGPSAPMIAAVFWILAAGAAALAARQANMKLRCITMRERVPEAAVVAIARASGLQGRMLTWFDWGEYTIWHLYPAIQVSYDGRRETVYSDRVMRLQHELYEATPEGLAYLRTLDAKHAWLPVWLPIVQKLKASGWRELFHGPMSVLLTRSASPAVMPPASGEPKQRCFPGP